MDARRALSIFRSRRPSIVPLTLLTLPVVFYVFFVSRFVVNVPAWDDWDVTIPLLHKLFAGRLGFSDLWAQYYEHRVLATNVVTLGVALVTHFDTRAEAFAGVALLLIAYGLLYAVYRNSRLADGASPSLWLFLPTAYLVFNVLQYESALWGGVQIHLYLVAACFSGALLGLQRAGASAHAFSMAVIAAVIASVSGAEGLLLWPIGLIYMHSTGNPHRRALLARWVLAGALTAALYLVGFDFRNTGGPSPIYALRHPGAAAGFLLALLGAVTPAIYWPLAAWDGLILVTLCIVVAAACLTSTERRHTLALGLTLIVFGALFDAMVAIGRAGFGLYYAIAVSEYAVYNLWVLCGLYLGLATLMTDGGGRRMWPGLPLQTVVLFLIGAFVSVETMDSSVAFALLGAIVPGEWLWASRDGLVLLALCFFLVAVWLTSDELRKERRVTAGFALTASAAVGGAVMAAGRGGAPWHVAYTAYGFLVACGLVVGFAALIRHGGRSDAGSASYRRALAGLLLILIVSVHDVSAFTLGVRGAARMRSARREAARVLVNYRVVSNDEIRRKVYAGGGNFREYAAFLDRHRLSVFTRR